MEAGTFPLSRAEKLENWPNDNDQRRSDHFGEDDELGLWWDGAHHPGVSPSSDDSLALTSSSTAGGGANWEDSNSNGVYDLGDTLLVFGSVFVGAASGGVGSGGGGSLPPDDTTSIPGPTGEAVAEIPGQEPLATACVETTFATQGVSLTDVNRAALAASNAIAGLADHRYEYSSIVFFHNGKVGFTEPYTELREGDVNLLGSIANVPTGAVILGIVHNHPDQIYVDDRYPSPADWAGYDQIQNLSSSGSLPREITADASLLFYILSDQDAKTRVYDNSDKRTETASCPLQ